MRILLLITVLITFGMYNANADEPNCPLVSSKPLPAECKPKETPLFSSVKKEETKKRIDSIRFLNSKNFFIKKSNYE